MKPKNPLHLALLTAIACTASARAANLTWDTLAGDGATITAGGGNWDTSTVIWNNAGSDAAWSQTSATVATNAAIFAGTDGLEGAYPVNVTTGIAAQTLAFNNTGYALSASAARTITLTSNTLSVASGRSASIGANVTASFSATGSQSSITGGGTLKISGTGATVTKPSNVFNIIGGTTVDVGTSGLLTTSSQIVIGTNSGNGTVLVNGGTASSTSTTATHNLILANASGANTISGTLTINSGTVTHPAVSGGLRFGNSTTPMTAPNTATGTLNLNGGQFTVARLYEGLADPLIISNVNFNGGKLIVRAGATNAANFMTGLDAANVLIGGAKIDTNGVDTTIAQDLLDGGGGGGLTKEGSGILTLTGSNTYTGATIINGGKLNLNAPYNSITATTVNSGARLRVTTAATPSALSDVTVNANGGLESNVGAYTIGQLEGITVTNFNAAGDYKVDLAGTGIPTGDITVLTYTNQTGTGVPSLGTTPTGVIGTVEDTGSAIVIHAQLAFLWTPGTGDWDTSTANWTGLGSTYTEGNPVAFPEIAGDNIVTLTATRSPSSVTIENNTTSTYTFTGSAIAGSGTVTKRGTGVTTLDVANSYTGTTAINGGGVIVNANNALGTADAGTVIASGAALGLKGGVTYSTAEPITGSGVANTVALGEFASVQRGLVQAITGACTFSGPIEINAPGFTRFGTQNGASLTLSGPITRATGVTGVQALFRTGTDGDYVTLSNSGNDWDLDTILFTGATGAAGGLRLGTDNALPTGGSIVAGGGSTGAFTTLDLNGNDQELNGLANSNGRLHILNSDSVDVSTLTLNPTANKSNYTIAANLTVIEDGAGKVNLVKEGPFTQTLHDPNTYSGSTTISGGSLQLGSFVANPKTGSIPNTTSMSIAAGANFDVSLLASYAVPASMPLTFKIDPAGAGSAGSIKAAVDLDVSSAAVTLDPLGTLDDPAYVLAEYTNLTGTPQFASVTGLPFGYHLDYAYNGGTRIALVADSVPGYPAWIALFPVVGGEDQPGDDPDDDGVENLLEFVLNGNPSVSDSGILPELVVTDMNFEFTYQRRDDSVSPETTQTFQWGTSLTAWPGSAAVPATSGTVGDATITVSAGTPDDGVTDTVKVSIPKTEAGGAGKLFGRLKVEKP
jgi:autotransporter-associated beta strand protein